MDSSNQAEATKEVKMANEIRIGMVGYKFMGRAHSNAYRQVARFFPDVPLEPVLKCLSGRDEAAVAEAAQRLGWECYDTDWRRLVARPDIDLVDISGPGNIHRDVAVAAARAGKHILCEKPLANSLAEAREMLAAVRAAGVKHMVGFNYRRVPAIALARRLIEEGRIGEIWHFRAVYLQDWIVDPEFPLVWRLRKELAGSGVLGDLGAHIIDLARYLVGEFTEVIGLTETFIVERPLEAKTIGAGLAAQAGKERGPVTVDDAALFLARFANGAVGSFEATRFASGRKNYLRLEINGSSGSLAFNLERLNELEFYSREEPSHLQGFRTILATDPSHPYIKAWWPAGHIIGWEHTFVHQAYDLLKAIAEDRMPEPDFEDGVKCQEVLEAVERSVEERAWVSLPLLS